MTIEKVELQINDGIIDTPHLIDDVEILQRRLKDWGLLPKDAKIDGLLGLSLRQQWNNFNGCVLLIKANLSQAD
ncbi:hypothetical protein Q5691_05320 [Microcoleus sp. w1-18aA5]|uniref:hypothetical protein n=1 Tax=Microcoleus sp. w1-18aA5 TaxID=2818982 RepID=UPI002FD51D77